MNICLKEKSELKYRLSKKFYCDNIISIEKEMNKLHDLSAIYVDDTIVSHRKYFGKMIVLVKKVIRKSFRWYINPIIERQNMFNQQVEKVVLQIYKLEREKYKI